MKDSFQNALLSLSCAIGVAACGTGTSVDAEQSSAPLVSEDGRYIVQFEGKANPGIVAEHGKVIRTLERHNMVVANLPEKALTALAKHGGLSIEPDYRRYPLAQTTPYGIPMVQADQVSDGAASNRTVCIIDTGYNLGHEDLPSGSQVTGTNDPSGTGNWFDDGAGHGTHVAGTIAAMNNGVGVVGVLPNGNIHLHIVKVFGNDGTWAYSSSLIGALDVCEANGANVVSMSLGGSQKSRSEDVAFAGAYSRGILSIAAAGNDGNTRHSYPASYDSVVSVAAIDENGAVADFSQQTNQVELAAPGVGVLSTVPMGTGSKTTVTVAGTDVHADGMDGSPFGSATGALVDCGLGESTCSGASGAVCLISRGNIAFSDKVLACEAGGGVAAIIYNNEPGPLYGTLGGVSTSIPSVGISDTDGAALLGSLGASTTVSLAPDNYAAWDGTSMATPHVSGVAALVWSHNPGWTNQEIRDALDASAMDLGAAGRDNAYGYGLVQAKAALDLLQGGGGCTPTETTETSCGDGIDNDCDGDIDGADADCQVTCTPTESTETSCGDGIDNDCDGDIDGADADCQTQCLPRRASCSTNSECCSNSCRRGRCR